MENLEYELPEIFAWIVKGEYPKDDESICEIELSPDETQIFQKFFGMETSDDSFDLESFGSVVCVKCFAKSLTDDMEDETPVTVFPCKTEGKLFLRYEVDDSGIKDCFLEDKKVWKVLKRFTKGDSF